MIKKIIELSIYSSIYFTIALFIGSIINELYSDYDDNKSEKVIFIELLFQMLTIIICAFLIHYITDQIPTLFSNIDGVSKEKIQLSGNIILALVFYTTQKEFKKKIIHLQDEVKLLFKK